jgi:hypothetical protein
MKDISLPRLTISLWFLFFTFFSMVGYIGVGRHEIMFSICVATGMTAASLIGLGLIEDIA